jgi:hypothetical protein
VLTTINEPTMNSTTSTITPRSCQNRLPMRMWTDHDGTRQGRSTFAESGVIALGVRREGASQARCTTMLPTE